MPLLLVAGATAYKLGSSPKEIRRRSKLQTYSSSTLPITPFIPEMSTDLEDIVEDLAEIVKAWFDGISGDFNAHAGSTPESSQLLYFDSIERNHRLWEELSTLMLRADKISQRIRCGAMSRLMIDGLVEHLRVARLAAFNDRCEKLLPPNNAEFDGVPRTHFQEIVFIPSDCFSELGNIHPGHHGWIFVFRKDLEEWLSGNPDPFIVTYKNENSESTTFGVYEVVRFPEGNMTGPEVACLSESTQNIIIAQASKDVQKYDYEMTRKALLSSHLTVSCFVLQYRGLAPPSRSFEPEPSFLGPMSPDPFFSPPPATMNVQHDNQISYSFSDPNFPDAAANSTEIRTTINAPLPRYNYKFPFHASVSADAAENFAAPASQADSDLQENGDPLTNWAGHTVDNVPGPSSTSTFVSNMMVDTSNEYVVPVPDPTPNEYERFNEGCFYNSQGYSPPAYQYHPPQNHQQDQIQFTDAYQQSSSRLQTADERQGASYGIPPCVSTNTRGSPLGYASQFSLQPPTPQIPPNKIHTRRSHGNNHNQDQNINPVRANGGGSSQTATGGGCEQEDLAQPFSNLSLVTRPQLPATRVHGFRRQVLSDSILSPSTTPNHAFFP